MKKILAVIDKRIDELRLKNNFSRNDHYLEWTEEEFEILKKSLIPSGLYDICEILMYRGISIKIKR